MIALTYTKAMKEQDALWNKGKENSKVMQKLQLQIVNEAKKKGFIGDFDFYIEKGESILEMYANPEEAERCRLGIEDSQNLFCKCKMVIDYLERELNKLIIQKTSIGGRFEI